MAKTNYIVFLSGKRDNWKINMFLHQSSIKAHQKCEEIAVKVYRPPYYDNVKKERERYNLERLPGFVLTDNLTEPNSYISIDRLILEAIIENYGKDDNLYTLLMDIHNKNVDIDLLQQEEIVAITVLENVLMAYLDKYRSDSISINGSFNP